MEKAEYGKLINGTLSLAPNGIESKVDGTWYIPAPIEMLIEDGYKPIEYTPSPEPKENYTYWFEWKDNGENIYREWHEEYIQPRYSDEERISALEEAFEEFISSTI